MRTLTLILLTLTACTCPDASEPTDAGELTDAGLPAPDAEALDSGTALPAELPLHALCFQDRGWQNCERVVCLDPYDGRQLVDQNGDPLEPRCGTPDVLGCWGVTFPGEPPTRIGEGPLYLFCAD